MPKATESIINFLTAKRDSGEHKGPDLLDHYLKWGCNMETQVNVAAGKGEPVAGKRSTFSDGIDTWFNFRIPKNAYDEPFFNDFTMKWPLDLHCEGIGSTGWDHKARRSRWVGFDFDSIIGHAEGVGVTSDELNRVREAAKALPYVQVRRSTGGSGLHLYVCFEDHAAFNTQNHNEHAALARSILSVMSSGAGFNFQDQIDACGGNMWLWHRKSAGTEGLALLKAGELFSHDKLPSDWRTHLTVVSGRRAKIRLDGIESDSEEDLFNQLATAHRQIRLDDKHKAMMDAIAAMGIACSWIPDHNLLQTHTVGFQKLMERAEEFGIQGVYRTNSKGSDLATPNCFAFPLDNGGWKIYRFGAAGRITEAATWEQDKQGRAMCWFNTRPGLDSAAKHLGGRKLDKSKGYEFDTLEKAVEVAKMLSPNFEMEIEDHLKSRTAVIRESKGGQIAIEIPKKGADEDRPAGNWNKSDKRGAWTQVFNIAAQPEKLEVCDYDNLIRCLETTEGQPAGWAAKKADGQWTRKAAGSIKTILQDLGHGKPEAEQIMGRYERTPWKLVMLPFQDEYPRPRCWNANAPQFRYAPAPRLDALTNTEEGEDSKHPHWDMIMDHIGADLTKYIKELDWTIPWSIRTGADYLRAVFASILRYPRQPTPYIFLFGPEESGKSILHESFELLVTGGVVKADRALTSQSDFNGELAGAILCVVEEKDVAKTPGADAKIKDAVTARKLSIRKMRTDSYMVDNTTHWIQCANSIDACPVFDKDSRKTMIFVDELPKGTMIEKDILIEKLCAEAPQFMRTLIDLPLPPSGSRLRVPIIDTQFKQTAAKNNRSSLEDFITENLHEAPGELLVFSDFYTRFIEWLPSDEKGAWSRVKVSKSMPLKFQTGTGNGNKTCIINASWEKVEPDPNAKKYFVMNNRIKKEQ